MGICYQDAKILWEARIRGVSFKDHSYCRASDAGVAPFRSKINAESHPW